ncbi:hypothetical protein ACFWNK_01925 [Streptomyces sp. NPDC058417]|uniref:hypothetical protein n=1 Tax=unclassified Streptomyces TaxID=2593676 RepID=UPI00365D01E5
MIWLATLTALTIGYTLGRYRPWSRLGDWADWQLRFRLARWQATRTRQAVLFGLLLLTDPAASAQAWRHRNDPPPPRIDPDWAEKRRAAQEDNRG